LTDTTKIKYNNYIYILKYLLDINNYNKYYNYIYNNINKENKEILLLYTLLKELIEKYNNSVSLSDYCLYVDSKSTSKNYEVIQDLLKDLFNYEINEEIINDILKDIKNKQLAYELAIVSLEVSEGRSSIETIQSTLNKFETSYEDSKIEFISSDLDTLVSDSIKTKGLRWRLNSLNTSLGSLRKGDFGFLFARPETGKTTFLCSEITHFATQVDRPILWFNNEEQGSKVMIRCYQSTFGLPLAQLLGDINAYQASFRDSGCSFIKLFDSATIHRSQVEQLCKELCPSLIIFDQLDKIKGFHDDREDLRLGSIYIWARELAKTYCPVIGVCQADASGEGKKWLTMDNVANAKCLSPDTKIVMYDGSLRKVGDIRVGEQVMGPDSTPRNVLDVSWGKSKMYSVHHNIGGDGYLVNKDHILSLIKSNNGAEQIVDIPIEEYLAIKCKKPYFGYRVGYELSHKYFSIDPYYLGLWLGDGKASAPEITTLEPEIKHYVLEYAEYLGCTYVEWQNGVDNPNLVQAKIKYRQGVKHPLMEKLRELNLENNKHIPEQYFHGSMAQRRLLLAGLIDTDGTLIKRKHEYYSFTNKNKDIAFGVKRLALSVGMYSTCVRRGEYYYVHISGDLSTIPCLVTRKQSTYKPSRDVLRSSLSVYEIKDEMEYCGILIDGDHRFILENSIVTHNTAKQAEADLILGIGKVHDEFKEYNRFINVIKNKLIGDEDTDSEKRHAKLEVMIKPDIARYIDT